jgi:hypothetical protein
LKQGRVNKSQHCLEELKPGLILSGQICAKISYDLQTFASSGGAYWTERRTFALAFRLAT